MKKTKFNWACYYCEERNLTPIAFQFDIPKTYTAIWECSKCGNKSEITFIFKVEGV